MAVLNATVPAVSIIGSALRNVQRFKALQIDADASVRAKCGGLISRNNLKVSWSVRRNNVPVSGLASISNSPTTFKLAAYKLEVGAVYYVYATVLDLSTGISTSNFVKVNVGRGALVAVIAIGNNVAFRAIVY